ncbi:uncharacterized protein LOC133744347 [Rosa rugosa]|uniref:uncharacterized protein LOC133744347 n=1 Tax=Rosa rugosa TaxID=74645 RepID=UPI002B410BE2|nr:uncharacterized protein LOC133744347 [Rosa rugosa]
MHADSGKEYVVGSSLSVKHLNGGKVRRNDGPPQGRPGAVVRDEKGSMKGALMHTIEGGLSAHYGEALVVLFGMSCIIDFRCLDEGFGGKTYKRKRNPEAAADYEDAAMKIDAAYPPPAKRSAVSSSDNPDKPVFSRPSYDVVIARKVSGRKWKQPRKQRSSAVQVSRKGTTFEEREKNNSVKKAYKERMAELKGEIKRNKEEKRRKREEREKKKKMGPSCRLFPKKRTG